MVAMLAVSMADQKAVQKVALWVGRMVVSMAEHLVALKAELMAAVMGAS